MRLRPWQRVLVTCGRCAAPAEFTATHDHYDDGEWPHLEGPPDRVVLRFACAAHRDEVMDRVTECCGTAVGDAVRYSWRYWIKSRFYLVHSAVSRGAKRLPNES